MKSKFLVPFETAKLLKEKGYPEYADIFYDANFYDANGSLVNNFSRSDYDAPIVLPVISSPTYHEVLDWLEGKGIRIEVRVAYQLREKQWSWCGYVYVVEDEDYETSQWSGGYSTREQALNASILKALEML